MKGFKSHFVFSRNQQNGIFLLVAIILVLQLVYFFSQKPSNAKLSAEENKIEQFQQQIDSLKLARAEAAKDTVYPFNPNYITDYRGYMLGMEVEEIDCLHTFRAGGNWVNSAGDFQKVTGVSDSLLSAIKPYFRFPEWVIRQQKQETVAKRKPVAELQNLNTATVEELQQVNGVGEVLSQRIVNYRTKIGGFLDEIQLKDVYGLDYETRGKITAKFAVMQDAKIERIDINSAGVLELSELPYFNYELAREIIDYRTLHERINNFEELAKIDDFEADRIDRIQLYLKID